MIPKFRGFRTKTEEWVEGNLIYREEPYQHDIVTPIGNCSTISYAVERDSIGQWTGLKDKNGVEIYESDIVVNHVGDVWVITYFRGAFRYYPIESFSEEKEKWFESDNIGNFGTEAFEVIGNIHENSDLLN